MPPRKRKPASPVGSSSPPSKKRKATSVTKIPSSAPRTAVSSLPKALYIGAHISAAGGVQNSVSNAIAVGANAFALFLKSQRKWVSPPLADVQRDSFRAALESHSFLADKIVPHGSYLVNLAQADEAKAAQGYASFLDDLRRCENLGIKLYNFHPGSSGGAPRDEALGRVAAQLNKAHAETSGVMTLIENMAGAGNVLGSRFEDLRDIIAGVEDKARVGVCLDTCHAFGAGYDLRTPEAYEATMKTFDDVVGLSYLKALHLNDSKAPLGSFRDIHANIGTGFLGLRSFHSIVNTDAFVGLPMVLETPIGRKLSSGKTEDDTQVWADEIKLLESLIGMDAEGDKFKNLEADLSAKGEGERKKLQEQVDKKAGKDAKKSAVGLKKEKRQTSIRRVLKGGNKVEEEDGESADSEGK